MEWNPMVEEVWRIEDELACEAGDDNHRLCQNCQEWTAGVRDWLDEWGNVLFRDASDG
jgi:hypothetical protein